MQKNLNNFDICVYMFLIMLMIVFAVGVYNAVERHDVLTVECKVKGEE